MNRNAPRDVTLLLQDWCLGERDALDKLVPLVYDELRRIAHRYMARERPGRTLQTAALVNEAYMRLIDAGRVQWEARTQFFGVAVNLMRRILVESARARSSKKRGATPASSCWTRPRWSAPSVTRISLRWTMR